MLTRLAALAGALATVLLALAAFWLVVHQPTIANTSRGDYQCLAPYDTVINRASNLPSGGSGRDAEAIAARCRSVGDDHFVVAVVAAVASVAFAAVTVVVIRRRRYE